MAITLKNITAADTISSMVDKINFNFDQLLLNGGGIEGPKGEEGYPGMQGIKGDTGEQGIEGEQGERGVHFHVLSRSDVNDAIINGLVQDPDDEYMSGDMIIAYIDDQTSSNYLTTDSIWKVEYDETLQKYVPTYAINSGTGSVLNFAITNFFEEFRLNGTNNRLLRPAKDDTTKRGMLINDYSHKADDRSITPAQLDSIITNNILPIYTEAFSEPNTEGSPNCGIVFYKVFHKDGDPPSIGSFPRINYVVSTDSSINYLNIFSPNQDIRIHAKKNVILTSEEGNVSITLDAYNKDFILSRKDQSTNIIKNIVLTTDGVANNPKNELHFAANEIFIEEVYNESSSQWLKIRNKNYNDTTSCEIELCKDNTYIKSDKFFSIGKSGVETLDIAQANSADYYSQARINVNNDSADYKIDILAPEINIGRNSTNNDNFGIFIKENIIPAIVRKNNTVTQEQQISEIIIDGTTNFRQNIKLLNTYPGVTKISNLSEIYLDSIINYTDESDENSDITRPINNNLFLCTSPMIDAIYKPGRYNYANINCYQNMSIRNIDNMGAVHSGVVVFTGNYGSNDTVKDKLIYNFTRVGNVVHCTFNGIINTNKISARDNTSGAKIVQNYVDKPSYVNYSRIGETYYKANNNPGNKVIVNWPTSNTIASNNSLPSYMEMGSFAPSGRYTELAALTGSGKIPTGLPSMSKVSLNQLILNLYPPVVKVTKSSIPDKLNTNIKNFVGHLTYSSGGTIYDKSLTYSEEDFSHEPNYDTIYKIPAIKISNMKNSTSSSTLAYAYNINTGSTTPTTVQNAILSGATEETLVEIHGWFSYILNLNNDGIMPVYPTPYTLGTSPVINGNAQYTSGNNVNVTHPTIIEDPIPAGPVSPGDDGPTLPAIEPED